MLTEIEPSKSESTVPEHFERMMSEVSYIWYDYHRSRRNVDHRMTTLNCLTDLNCLMN